MKIKLLDVLIGFLVLVTGCTDTPIPQIDCGNEPVNSIQLIRDDMALLHEGSAHGIPSWFDWAYGPRIGYGNTPPEGWTAMVPWGQFYTDSLGHTTKNTRVQIKNLQAWYLSRQDSQWIEWITTSEIEGAYFVEDFKLNRNKKATIWQETNCGGISVLPKKNYNFHFWPSGGRIPIDPNNIAGVWVSVEARLVVSDPDLDDDRDNARLLLNCGADYWLDESTNWNQLKTNGDIAISRFRYLTNDWQVFNMHTLTGNQLNYYPPPY